MDEVDINQSGQLEYSEFITAVMKRAQIVANEVL
jgi:hypothetical protein